MVFIVNATKTHKCVTPGACNQYLFVALAFCSFSSAENAPWFALQTASRDVISLAAQHAHLTSTIF
jgi:hypothetical protein